MSDSEQWYIVKQAEGQCQIITAQELEASQTEASQTNENPSEEQWGPFDSEGEAIARRIGLIRSGKCNPA
jgi:hypothetical protein